MHHHLFLHCDLLLRGILLAHLVLLVLLVIIFSGLLQSILVLLIGKTSNDAPST